MTHVLGEPIPEALMRSAATWGEPGARWLDALPDRVDGLVARWELTPELPLCPDGQCSIVVPVRSKDGTACVLKVQWPHPEAEHEADALRAYDGRGAVRLIEEDRARNALLLERCEPGIPAWEAGDRDEVLRISAAVMKRLWRPVDPNEPFLTLQRAALERAEKIRHRYVEHGRPFEAELAEAGSARFEELGTTASRTVLLHGDFHPSNVLRAQREPWLAVDPKPLVGDPAFDTAQLLLNFHGRGWSIPIAIDDLAAQLGLERDRIGAWLFARSVEEITWSLADRVPIGDDLARARLFSKLR